MRIHISGLHKLCSSILFCTLPWYLDGWQSGKLDDILYGCISGVVKCFNCIGIGRAHDKHMITLEKKIYQHPAEIQGWPKWEMRPKICAEKNHPPLPKGVGVWLGLYTECNIYIYTSIYIYTYMHACIHYIRLDYISLHYSTLHHITSNCITLHQITSNYITLHHITSYHITLHHITYITSLYIT